jgi:hypothetical protein
MEVTQIVLVVFIALIVIYIIIRAFTRSATLTKMSDGKITQMIEAKELKNNTNSNNFTYSMWINIDDWNYNYGQEKMILDRANGPTVVLGDKPNTLKVYMKYYDTAKGPNNAAGETDENGGGIVADSPPNAATQAACTACQSGYTCACDSCKNGVPDGSAALNGADVLGGSGGSGGSGSMYNGDARSNSSVNTCLITNIPIQKWVNIIISLYGSTLDVYLDGKLVRTCVLPGVPQLDNQMDLNVTNKGGFSGWTTNFKYWSDASNPQQAYNIYKDGFGGSILGNLISKYRLRVAMMTDNVEQTSFEI